MPKKRLVPVKVNDDFSYVSAKDGQTYKLTFKEKKFCESYLAFYGNGVEAIFAAGYGAKNALVASAMASEYLRKPNVVAYVDSLLEQYGFNDNSVEKQHLFILNQYSDLRSKAKAIDMFYKLRGDYAPEKRINVNVEAELSDIGASMKKIAERHAK